MGHDSGDLVQMSKVMCRTRCQQLRKRDRAERGMQAVTVQVLLREIQGTQFGEILSPDPGKFVQQFWKRLTLALALLGAAVERGECAALAEFQNSFRARHPVGALSMDQVPEHIERTERVSALISQGPLFRQIT